MAKLEGQSIAASYDQLLHVDRDGGGNTTTLVDVKDGDNGTTFALKLAQYHAEVRGTTGTGATGAGKLNLATSELTVVDNDVLGKIDFLAPLESSGTDAILAGASIWGEAEDTFAADNNSTGIVFATNTSAAAAEKMRLTSSGKLGIGVTDPDESLEVSGKIHASGGIYSGAITIADDAVGSITPPRQGVIMSILCEADDEYPQVAQSGLVYCDTGTSLAITAIWDNSQFDVSTSDVTGTTGVDTNVTVAVQSGTIKIENRIGSSLTFYYSFIG